MFRQPPRSTRTDTLFPYTTLFRSGRCGERPEIAAVQAVAPIRVHEENLVGRDDAAPFPNGQRSMHPILLARSADRLSVNGDGDAVAAHRSAERSVGKEWVSTCRYRWSAYH